MLFTLLFLTFSYTLIINITTVVLDTKICIVALIDCATRFQNCSLYIKEIA